jgi:hypothetical protein
MKDSIERKIRNLIDTKSEGDYWDFKQEWHKDNERLLHDILCFANTVHDRDCHIIIGVSDSGEVIGVNKDERLKQAGILDLLSNTVFAGDNTPDIRVDTIIIEGKEIDVLTILNSYTVPYYLKSKSKKYNNIKEGYIYTRVGDKNTPITQNATIQQIEMLWKKRLGLTQPPLLQIVSRIENKSEWVGNEDIYYNLYKPEFRLIEQYEGEEYGRKRGEFYVYSQTNSRFSYKNLKIMFNQTTLEEFQLVVLDSGRYKTPIPEWGYIGYDKWHVNHKYTYKYYLKNSIAYKLQLFFYDADDMEEVHAKRRFDEVILYFEHEGERLEFEYYVENNQSTIDSYLLETKEVYYSVDTENERDAEECKHKLSVGLALNRALEKFREYKRERL